jgi:hypothetical protein
MIKAYVNSQNIGQILVYPSVHSLNFSAIKPIKYNVTGGLCGTSIVDPKLPDLWYSYDDGLNLVPEKPGCPKCHVSESFVNYWK